MHLLSSCLFLPVRGKKPQPKATRFTVFGGKHYWTEHSPKGLTQRPEARVIRVRARRPLEPCLCTAVTATGSKGKRERLLERKRSWWQRHLNVHFNNNKKKLLPSPFYVCMWAQKGSQAQRTAMTCRRKLGRTRKVLSLNQQTAQTLAPAGYILQGAFAMFCA